jgi:peroxiredoxin
MTEERLAMMIRTAVCSLMVALLLAAKGRAEAVVAAPIADFHLPDYVGKELALADLADRDLVVVAFLGTECPLAKLYAERLQAIANDYSARGVAVVAIMSNAQDSLAKIAAFVRQYNLTYPVLKDRRNAVADLFGAERTSQVFLLDRKRTVRYRGRVDDQYLVGIARNKPTRADLRLAIDELMSGKPVSVPQTNSLGCIIGRAHKPNGDSPVTYARDIAPILQARCVECHRAGEIGPFELTSYEESAGWGEMIAEVVRKQRMPPWHADPKHGSFANDRSLPASEKQLLLKWVENGCPQGDPADMPKPRQFTPGWQLPRQPDLVISMEEPFTVPATVGPAGVPYQHFRVPTNFKEDKWIAVSEVQPGNRAVVHHTIVYLEPPGKKGRDNWIFLSAYVPGLRTDPMPAGAAKRIPAGSTLIFEMHYTPNGSVQQDTTRIGFVFADLKQIDKEVITTEVGNKEFEIPPGAESVVVTATSRPTTKELTLLSLSPHMHLRGKAFRYELVLPNGEREVLLDVPEYDFNWQTRYRLAEPRRVPVGSLIHCRAVYDNSQTNLANPDRTKTVRWGDQSWDEMMLGFFDVILPRDDMRKTAKKPVRTGLDVVGLFDAADADHNAGLDSMEAAGNDLLKAHFPAIDRNGDGLLQLGEIMAAMRAQAALPK